VSYGVAAPFLPPFREFSPECVVAGRHLGWAFWLPYKLCARRGSFTVRLGAGGRDS
jgi:hypothetical protein